MKRIIKNQEELKEIAQDLRANIEGQRSRESGLVVALSGDLGSGKTTFTKEFAHQIGVTENVASPTFVIERVYPIDLNGFKNFVHIDAYRMEKDEDILALGWNDLIANKENLIFIEWPEIVAGVIPDDVIHIKFEHGDLPEARIITVNHDKD